MCQENPPGPLSPTAQGDSLALDMWRLQNWATVSRLSAGTNTKCVYYTVRYKYSGNDIGHYGAATEKPGSPSIRGRSPRIRGEASKEGVPSKGKAEAPTLTNPIPR